MGRVKSKRKQGPVDFTLLITVIMLVFIGMIMVYSSSWPEAMLKRGDGGFFLKREILYIGIGTFGMLFFMNIDYKIWEKFALPIYILALCSVFLVFTHTGYKGGRRWVKVGPITFMPADIVKIASIIYFSKFLTQRTRVMRSLRKGTIPALGIIGLTAVFIIIQKDLGTTIILTTTLLGMFFIGGMRLIHMIPPLILGIFGINILYIKAINSPGSDLDIRLQRILSFKDPFAYRTTGGWQAVNSLHALGSGGIFGLGFGKSRQKFFYIPEAYNDFIFAIIGEELGLVGATFVIILYMILVSRGVYIARNINDNFGSFLAAGLSALTAVQTIVHIAVVTSSIPTTGITLPFISYGGTSLIIYMSAMGILLNISRYIEKV